MMGIPLIISIRPGRFQGYAAKGTKGILANQGRLPRRTAASSWDTGVARILIRASHGKGGRRSFSMILRASGLHLAVTTTLLYFIVIFPDSFAFVFD